MIVVLQIGRFTLVYLNWILERPWRPQGERGVGARRSNEVMGVTSELSVWAFQSKWTITPFEERSWSEYLSHLCVIRPFPVLSGRLHEATSGCHRRALLSFHFICFAFAALLSAVSPLLFSYLPRSNPILMLPSPSSSPTQTELCVHSLIHDQSYLSSGTIATAQAPLETTARRKITPIPQDCWTL